MISPRNGSSPLDDKGENTQERHLALALDAYAPEEMARRAETAGTAKARLSVRRTLMLAILAGAFIAFGAMLFLLVSTGNEMGFGLGRWVAGIAFSLGLVLVVVAGAELFTGNSLIVIAWADRLITSRELLRNWLLVYLGNTIGAAVMAVLSLLAGLHKLGGGAFGETAALVASAKTNRPLIELFFSGILCNVLVCLAVWMCFSARRVTGKILAIIFPISAFVALGFEHSIANLYLIPFGMLAGDSWDFSAFLFNLVPVTFGNIVGGGLLVAAVYWIIYRMGETRA